MIDATFISYPIRNNSSKRRLLNVHASSHQIKTIRY